MGESTESAAGDAAKLREALKASTRRLERIIGCDRHEFHPDALSCDGRTSMGECRNKAICDDIFAARKALSTVPRNCDRFASELDAQIAFLNEEWLISVDRTTILERDKIENWTDLMLLAYSKWLFETASKE